MLELRTIIVYTLDYKSSKLSTKKWNCLSPSDV